MIKTELTSFKRVIGILILFFFFFMIFGCDSDSDDSSTDSSECTAASSANTGGSEMDYPVIDTMQDTCYDLDGNEISCGSEYSGQDAEYTTTSASYTSDCDVVTDNNTGLVWEYDQTSGLNYDSAASHCESQSTGGYTDWRMPTMKELFTIADFNGELVGGVSSGSTPYIYTDYFGFEYNSDYAMATQTWSSDEYQIGTLTDTSSSGTFGFNFADGHIKGYGNSSEISAEERYVRCVRGDENIVGVNDFSSNGTTVTDNATGLMWQQDDDGTTRDWEVALSYCEDLSLDSYSDWRLPDAKELHSIVDYSVTDVPAIDTSVFDSTFNDDYGDSGDYGWYWTSTTAGDDTTNAVYIAFGRAYSTLDDDSEDEDDKTYYDWHGAGALRSDPKTEDQVTGERTCTQTACDKQRVYNYVRCVRDAS